MGIPHYFYVITRTYEGILLKQLPALKKCHHFMLDYNGLIHPSSAKYLKQIEAKPPKDIEKGILQEVWKDTQELVSIVQPEKSVQIYVDGVAPLAKMNQQRRRRFLSVYRKKKLQEGMLWDSNAISPGTSFMARLSASIRAHIRYNKGDIQYYFNSADEPGEGEHKLFERLVRLYNDPTETKVIYGMDADLIMLSLLSHVSNIYLLRENPKVPEEFMYLDIDALRMGILKDLSSNYGFRIRKEAFQDIFGNEAKEVIESYIVLCFLLGNDFLPHSVMLQLKKGGLENLLMQAAKLWNEMEIPVVDIEHDKIQWNFITQLLEMLSQNENEMFYDEVARYWNKKPHYDTKEQELECYPLLNKHPLVYHLLFKIDRHKWRLYYYKTLFHSSMNDSHVIMNSCDLYLKGILWTYQYYKRKPYDSMWYYPYAYSPTVRDISNYLNGHLPYYEGLKEEWETKHPHPVFVDNIVQLLSILPKESNGCLPMKYQPLTEEPRLQYMYPETYQLHTFMKDKLWECVPILPPMNIPWIKEIISRHSQK